MLAPHPSELRVVIDGVSKAAVPISPSNFDHSHSHMYTASDDYSGYDSSHL